MKQKINQNEHSTYRGVYAMPFMAHVAQPSFIGYVNVRQFPREYKRLSEADKAVVDGWVRFGTFAGCNYQKFNLACPVPTVSPPFS